MGFEWSRLLEQRETYATELSGRLHTINTGLEIIEKEINNLSTTKEIIEMNIDFLKKEHVIASTFEYRKNKEDLHRTVSRLNFLIDDRVKIIRAMGVIQKLVEDNNQEYDLLLQKIENVVISGRFGENKDG